MPYKLQILHASDLEAGIPALDDAPRFSAVVNGLRNTYANTLILSSGDNYLPGPFFSASADPSLDALVGVNGTGPDRRPPGRADIRIMNEIGFQAAAFGNHEFDLGTRAIRDVLVPFTGTPPAAGETQYQGARFPYLSANLNFATNADLGGSAANTRVITDGQQVNTNGGAVANTFYGRIARSAVLTTADGTKVGIVGATTPTLPSISSPGPNVVVTPSPFANTPTAAQLDALAAQIQPSVDALVTAGINKIILMAHMQQLDIERALATRMRNVDVIIAGGSHTLLADSTDRLRPGETARGAYPFQTTDANGKPILVINTEANFKYVGRLVLDFDDTATADVIPSSLNPAINGAYAADEQGVAALGAAAVADPEVVQIANALKNVINTKDGNKPGKTTAFLNGTRGDVRTQETNLGSLTADANLYAARRVDPTVVISLKNGGGIRDNIGAVEAAAGATDPNAVRRLPPQANAAAGKAEGDVSQLDIENSLRFNNALSLVTVTAAQLKEVMEHGVAASNATGATPGQFPQVSGIAFSYDLTRTARTTAGTGQRVRSIAITDADGGVVDVVVQNGTVVGDPNRTFRMVTLDFLAGGGDSYPFQSFTARNQVDLATVPSTERTFTTPGTEQKAFADYLAVRYPNANFAYNTADVGPDADQRIQNLGSRNDAVFKFARRNFDFASNASASDFKVDGSANAASNFPINLTRPDNAQEGKSGSSFLGTRFSISADTFFETRFRFQLQGNLGDGFAFIIKDEAFSKTGIAGGYLGFQQDRAGTAYNSLAVEFDTHRNLDSDSSNGQWGDPNDNHIAVLSKGSATNHLAIATPSFDLNSGTAYNAWVDYNGQTDSLQVFVSESETKPTTALLSYNIDLLATVGTSAVVGFSGATGNFRNTQDIQNFRFNYGAKSTSGGNGADTLIAAINERIVGNDGNDILLAGRGNNTVIGGAGSDRFEIVTGGVTPVSANTISDFQAGTDSIALVGLTGVTAFGNITLTQQGSDTLVSAANTNLAVLTGIQSSSLSASNFVFG